MTHRPPDAVLARAATHPAQAYLFAGSDDAGAAAAAELLARQLLGVEALAADPDFVRVTREEGKKELSVEQARELCERMRLTSARGGRKVALVEQADRWSEAAANALLKELEEPSPSTVYLFLAVQPERLPATLRSRLVTFTFDVPMDARRSSDPSLSDLLETLRAAPLGRQLAVLEALAKRLEAEEDPESRWREALTGLMWETERAFAADPSACARVAHGLIRAWKLAGTSLSPRLGLEWAAVQPYLKGDRRYPSFLTSSSTV